MGFAALNNAAYGSKATGAKRVRLAPAAGVRFEAGTLKGLWPMRQ
jgi:hypothetical protein